METENFSLSAPGVLDKYMEAGKIANSAMAEAISMAVPGADIHTICKAIQALIVAKCSKIYLKSKIEKGPSFPPCISVNQVCGHFCPLKDESVVLKEGDVAKIDLGVHIDGFPVNLAHTIIVGGAKMEDPNMKVLSAAYKGVETMVKSLKPGASNMQVTENLTKVFNDYKVTALEGVLSHEVGKYALNGDNCIGISADPQHRVNETELKINQVFVLDVIVSANPTEGKTKESELRTTVFKRNIDVTYDLKTKLARSFLNDIRTNCHDMGFSISLLENELEARVGSSECLKNGHLEPFNVIEEKTGAVVAQFKWTVAISSKRLILLAHRLESDELLQQPTEALMKDEVLGPLLQKPLADFTSSKKKKKNKKKK
jgi:curved DNA binding protein